MAEPDLYAEFTAAADEMPRATPRSNTGAIRKVMALADRANQYIDDRKPGAGKRPGSAVKSKRSVVSA